MNELSRSGIGRIDGAGRVGLRRGDAKEVDEDPGSFFTLELNFSRQLLAATHRDAVRHRARRLCRDEACLFEWQGYRGCLVYGSAAGCHPIPAEGGVRQSGPSVKLSGIAEKRISMGLW